MFKNKRIKIGIVGCGAIGRGVAFFIDKKLKKNALVSALADINLDVARDLAKKISSKPEICDSQELIKKSDLIIETASVEAAKFILKKALIDKKDVLILSIGALIEDLSIIDKLQKQGNNVYIPSGAICGVDALGALAMGNIKKITLTTSKPPKGLIGADYLVKRKIRLGNLKKEKIVFEGTVAQAVKHFPKNINVAATLLVASRCNDIKVCIKADPNIKRNIHNIAIASDEANINLNIENMPSKNNPKTSAMTVLSVQYLLNKLFSPFKVGS